MIEVRGMSGRVMAVVLVFEGDALIVICGYVSQSVRRLEEKKSFHELKGDWNMPCADDSVMCLGDFNKHIGWHIGGFDGVHGGYSIGQMNL